ncbi:rhodanese-like domain-containing protein [Aurantivibrio plasticivorans]
MPAFKTLEVEHLQSTLTDNSCVLLDCRTTPDYKIEHMEDALHAHDALVESLLKNADKNKHIVIYCYHGHSSEHLAELFANFGFNNVYSLAGGFDAWRKFNAQ